MYVERVKVQVWRSWPHTALRLTHAIDSPSCARQQPMNPIATGVVMHFEALNFKFHRTDVTTSGKLLHDNITTIHTKLALILWVPHGLMEQATGNPLNARFLESQRCWVAILLNYMLCVKAKSFLPFFSSYCFFVAQNHTPICSWVPAKMIGKLLN